MTMSGHLPNEKYNFYSNSVYALASGRRSQRLLRWNRSAGLVSPRNICLVFLPPKIQMFCQQVSGKLAENWRKTGENLA
jgi:hypothetical protein